MAYRSHGIGDGQRTRQTGAIEESLITNRSHSVSNPVMCDIGRQFDVPSGLGVATP